MPENDKKSSQPQSYKELPCHPLYTSFKELWELCRLVVEGSHSVKSSDNIKKFIDKRPSQSEQEYASYIKRAYLFEASSRTVVALLGMLFSSSPILREPEKGSLLQSITVSYTTFVEFLKSVAKEVLITGRVGILADFAGDRPILSYYTAENIVFWNTDTIDGIRTLTSVMLTERSFVLKGDKIENVKHMRSLVLENGQYSQHLYKYDSDSSSYVYVKEIVPKSHGIAMTEIPFYFINSNGGNPDPIQPPLLSLVETNIAHFRNSADYEHMIHMLAMPTGYISGVESGDNKKSEKYTMGSATSLLLLPLHAKADFMQLSSSGAAPLQDALKEKRDLMVVLGVRALDAPKNISESEGNQLMRKQGENSILANIALSISERMNKAIDLCAGWSLSNPDEYEITLVSDFGVTSNNPAVIANLIAAVQGGLISHETFIHNMKKMKILPDGQTYLSEIEKIKVDQSNRLGEFDVGAEQS